MLPDRPRTTLVAVWLCAAILSAAGHSGNGVGASVRFHHVHVAVPDPGEALTRLAEVLNGTRTILQGHGVAVRVGGEYLVLDRARRDPRGFTEGIDAKAAGWVYAQAVGRLKRQDVTATPLMLADTRIGGVEWPGPITHVAFATADLQPLLKQGSTTADVVLRKPPNEAALYALLPGVTLEIISDTDRADAFWCPMHPDIRTTDPARCPICGMALVAIPPPRVGEYALDVDATPSSDGGISALRLVVREPDTGDAVSAFSTVHEKPFHLFVLSRDLAYFAHVHPEQDADGSFGIAKALPPGEYVLIADFVPANGTPQMVQRVLATPGYRGPLFAPVSLAAGPQEQTVDGVRVALDTGGATALRRAALRFTFSDARTGEPLRDLEPYLGASAHLLIVSPDLTTAIHAHPDGPPVVGPVVTFDPVIPKAGVYKLWVQIQRRGAVVTAPFVIEMN
jgi:heavy metal-binding protein